MKSRFLPAVPAVLVLTVLVWSFGGGARAEPFVCRDTPGTGERVECVETDNTTLIERNLDGVAISTTDPGRQGGGIFLWKKVDSGSSAGNISLTFRNGSITAAGSNTNGINVNNDGTGDIYIDVRDSTIFVKDRGINALGTNDVYIVVTDSSIRSLEDFGRGIYGDVKGAGNLDIVLRGADVTTDGIGSHGVDAFFRSTGSGKLRIRILDGSSVTTSGAGAYGIYARSDGTGGIDILLDGASVETRGGRGANNQASYGVIGLKNGDGQLRIRVTNGSSVTTSGAGAFGVYGSHDGSGDIFVIVQDSTVTTSGDSAHGILGWHQNAGGGIDIRILRNAFVRASGAGSHGIWVVGGELDADGNRRQTVFVDGEVRGGSGAAGILLSGGGRVIIGPHGRVGAESGIAIFVIRADAADTTESPRLFLDLMLDGRLPEKVLLGQVVNEHGTIGLTVNGVRVFDDAAGGAVDVWVQNGAWELRATGTDLSTLAFERVFAPRAAVYEALPGVLLRLDEAGGMGGMGGGGRLRSPDTPVWARIAGGRGSYEPDSATVGAEYDYDRFSVETGVDFPLDHGLFEGELTGWAGLRVVSGSADVSAPTGGGRIEARGYGLTGGLAWEGEGDWYGKGRLSLTRYSADLFSAARGGLKRGAGALVHSLGLEGGRRFGLDLMGVKTRLTARGTLRRSGISLDKFEDGLFSQVSVPDADRLAAGAGVAVETGLLPRDGVDRLVLRGSLDAEQVLSGGTAVDVSDTVLKSKAGATGFGAGLGGAYRMGGYTLGGSIGAGGLGSGDTSYSGRFELRIAF